VPAPIWPDLTLLCKIEDASTNSKAKKIYKKSWRNVSVEFSRKNSSHEKNINKNTKI